MSTQQFYTADALKIRRPVLVTTSARLFEQLINSVARAIPLFVTFSLLLCLYANLTFRLSTPQLICLWSIPIVVLLTWLASKALKLSIRSRHIHRTGMRPIIAMTQPQFEHSLMQAYRQLGYRAKVITNEAKNPGADLELTRPSEKIFVQLKHWRSHKVEVQQIRQLLLTAANHGATKAIVITTGVFTPQARHFAQASPTKIELVDARSLNSLLQAAPRAAIHSQ
jgi:HJR/Mrr/RecB family endonuclease